MASDKYLTLPVVSLCSRGRHTNNTASILGRVKVLDLHTSEVPIETTDLDLTIGKMGLRECVVNGVLAIYAVERNVSGQNAARGSGQDAIFMNADCWVCVPPYQWI